MADEKPVTEALVTMLRQRAEHGLAKYGTTLDRQDLTEAEWCQHALEEMLDGAGYLLALKRRLERIDRHEILKVVREMRENKYARGDASRTLLRWATRLESAITGQPLYMDPRNEDISRRPR